MAKLTIHNNTGPIKLIETIRQNPSFIAEVVNGLSKIDQSDLLVNIDIPLPFEIEEKITYNDLLSYRYLIEGFGIYHQILNDIYNTIEEFDPSARNTIINRINMEYKRIKGGLLKSKDETLKDIEIIRSNSDNIISQVKQYLFDLLERSSNIDKSIREEHIELALEIVIGDAFVNCKILEPPL